MTLTSVNPTTVSPGDTLTVTWTLTEETGVNYTGFSLCTPGAGNNYSGGAHYGTLISGQPTNGTYQASITFPTGYAGGAWGITVVAMDTLTNYTNAGCDYTQLTVN